ncbi:MAG: hypothetical protein ACRESX_08590 [Gammaproteobacteria bacterium]
MSGSIDRGGNDYAEFYFPLDRTRLHRGYPDDSFRVLIFQTIHAGGAVSVNVKTTHHDGRD